MRITGEAPDGTTFEAYMKGPTFSEQGFPHLLEREWVAGQIARQLELPCALPLQVRLNPTAFAEHPDRALLTQLREGPDVLFASLSGGSGMVIWSEAWPLPRKNLQLAAEIYLFDTVVQNWDRCIPNPNLLVRGDRLLMIDHGETFVSATGTDAERDYQSEPWKLDAIMNHHGDFETHPLWPKLRPKSQVDFAAAAAKWRALPDDAFELAVRSMPDCWNSAVGMQIAAYLTEAVENMDAIVANIEQNFER